MKLMQPDLPPATRIEDPEVLLRITEHIRRLESLLVEGFRRLSLQGGAEGGFQDARGGTQTTSFSSPRRNLSFVDLRGDLRK